MKSWLLAVFVILVADVGLVHAQAAPVPAAAVDARSDGGFTLVKKKSRKAEGGGSSSSGSNMQVLKGDLAWIVAGALWALIPAVFFVLPVLWLPGLWGGPGAVLGPFLLWGWMGFSLLFVTLWAALMTGAGSTVAWAVMSLLSDTRSGFLLPILVGTLFGGGVTLVSGLLAAFIVAMGGLLNTLVFFPFYLGRPDSYFVGGGTWGPITWLAMGVAFLFWATGVVVAGIGAPFLAAWLYKRLGAPRAGNKFHVEVLTE